MVTSSSVLSGLSLVEDERLVSLKWKLKSSLNEHLPDTTVSEPCCLATEIVPGSKNANRGH